MFIIYFPIYDQSQPVQPVIDAFKQQTDKNFKLLFTPLNQNIKFKGQSHDFLEIPDSVRFSNLNRARQFNQVLKEYPADFFIALPPYIIPEPEFLETILKNFQQPETAMVYSDYAIIDKNHSKTEQKLFTWKGQFDERFDFGFVQAYQTQKIIEKGYFDESLNVMEKYSLHLKLLSNYSFSHIQQPLYQAVVPPKKENEDTLSNRLYSPGGGGLGQFSYLFYPQEMEKEVTEVFYDWLKLENAFLTHPTHQADDLKDYSILATVVIPVLNRVKFIENAVNKVIQGTFENFEVIVVDNGSTDGTCEKVDRIKDPRIRLIKQNGKTIASALNRGIKEAKGKYICQLDSDDEYTPQTLEKMIQHMENHPKCGCAISYYEVMDENCQVIPELGIIKHLEFNRNNILRTDGAGALRVFRKSVLEEFGYYNEEKYGNFGEDYDMILKVSEKYDIDRVHHVLYRYRRHPDNTDVIRDPVMKIENKLNARLEALERRKLINKGLQEK